MLNLPIINENVSGNSFEYPLYTLVTTAVKSDWKYMKFMLESLENLIEKDSVLEHIWIVENKDYSFFLNQSLHYNYTKILVLDQEEIYKKLYDCKY